MDSPNTLTRADRSLMEMGFAVMSLCGVWDLHRKCVLLLSFSVGAVVPMLHFAVSSLMCTAFFLGKNVGREQQLGSATCFTGPNTTSTGSL